MSYYIKGNKERGAEVIKLLESKGGKNYHNFNGKSTEYYYIDILSGKINYTELPSVIDNLLRFCEELTLPEKKWVPKRGETILVRQDKNLPWKEGIFSFYYEPAESYCIVGGIYYYDCIPFDESKLGKVTDE